MITIPLVSFHLGYHFCLAHPSASSSSCLKKKWLRGPGEAAWISLSSASSWGVPDCQAKIAISYLFSRTQTVKHFEYSQNYRGAGVNGTAGEAAAGDTVVPCWCTGSSPSSLLLTQLLPSALTRAATGGPGQGMGPLPPVWEARIESLAPPSFSLAQNWLLDQVIKNVQNSHHCRCTTICLLIHRLVDVWISLNFYLLQLKLLWAFLCTFLCGYRYCFPWGNTQEWSDWICW